MSKNNIFYYLMSIDKLHIICFNTNINLCNNRQRHGVTVIFMRKLVIIYSRSIYILYEPTIFGIA